MTEVKSIAVPVHIDFNQMRNLVHVATRRVSAFVRLGLDGLPERGHGDFNLDASINYQFWPSEIDEQARTLVRDEFSAWLVGSCLRELDLFYSLFLDQVWLAIEASSMHETMVPRDFEFDKKFSRKTNVAKKQKEISTKLSIEDHYDEMNSLSLARNALTHHAGVVRAPVDCNNDQRNRLHVKWLAFDMVASRGGEDRIVKKTPFDTEELPGEGEIGIALHYVPRVIEFSAGARVSFTNAQLAEFCMFYKLIAEKTITGLVGRYREMGLVTEEGSEEKSVDPS